MVMSHDRNNGVRKINRGKYVSAYAGVQFHLLELGRSKCSWFIKDVLWDGEFSHVVKQRSGLYRSDLCGIFDANRPGQSSRIVLNSSDMTVRYLVLGIDRHGQSLNGRHVQRVQFREMLVGVFDTPQRHGKGEIQNRQQR